MALNHSKSVTAHKNSINRTIKYVSKLTLNKATSCKGWDKKLINIRNVQSKQQSDSTSKKILNDNTEKLI